MFLTIGGLKRLSQYLGGQLKSAVSITGGTIAGVTLTGSAYNGTVGATTPSTGAFTTLSSSGTYTATGLISQSNTTTATALSNTYGVVGAMTASATGITSGNLRGVRGSVTMSGTVTGGAYLYGVQGKYIMSGTQNHADSRIGAVLAQLDCSAATCTAGYLDAIWADMGATGPTAGWNTNSNCIRCTNTTSGNVNSIYYGYGKAAYGFDLSDNSSGWIAAAGTGSGSWANSSYQAATYVIKVNINGATKYIPLKDTNA